MAIGVDVQPRGALTISLQSPSGWFEFDLRLINWLLIIASEYICISGMTSHLLAPRPNDQSTYGLSNWNLTSAQFWGENPSGQWRLYLSNLSPKNQGILHFCSLILYGFWESKLMKRTQEILTYKLINKKKTWRHTKKKWLVCILHKLQVISTLQGWR